MTIASTSAAELASALGDIAGHAAVAPSAAALAPPMSALAERVSTLASAWTAVAESLRTSADECQALCATVERERTAIPDASAVREARANVLAATTELSRARARLATREGEEAAARDRAGASAGVLRAALLAAALPDDCDTGALAEAVRDYRSAAERWLHAGIDQLRTAGTAQLAHARSIASAETASKERAEADRQQQQLIEKETELSELASAYGSDYQQIITELEQLAADQECLDRAGRPSRARRTAASRRSRASRRHRRFPRRPPPRPVRAGRTARLTAREHPGGTGGRTPSRYAGRRPGRARLGPRDPGRRRRQGAPGCRGSRDRR